MICAHGRPLERCGPCLRSDYHERRARPRTGDRLRRMAVVLVEIARAFERGARVFDDFEERLDAIAVRDVFPGQGRKPDGPPGVA